jgi:hypothetical protein
MSLIENNVPITGPVTPWYTEDTFPSHIETYGQGGYRSVADAASRLLIIPERRLEGMIVKQLSDNTYWTLSGGILDANWLQIFGIVDDLAYQVVSTFTSLPATGNPSLIYLVLDTKVYYTWNGSAYVSVNSTVPSGALTNNLGNWNATTNSPTITGGTGTAGDFYIVSVAGTTAIDGISKWEIGDYIWFDDSTSTWRKIDNQSTVSSGNRLEVVVTTETELVDAFELINNNYVGGVIRLGAEIHLTADRIFNHDNITIECDYNRFYMNGYSITVNGGSCFYNNGFFDGGGAVSKFIFTASSGSTNYSFNNTRFYKFIDGGTRDVFDMSGGTTSMHLFLKDCWMTGDVTINTNIVQIKVSSYNAMADVTILSNRTLSTSTQTNIYGFVGTHPGAALQYIYDGSTVVDTSILTPSPIYNIINGTMTYPSAGIPISTGSAWNPTSITPATGYLRYTGAAFEWKNETYLTSQISHADVLVDGDFTSQGIMLRGASSGTYSILTDNSANWNTAFGWGNHALAGYLTALPAHTLDSHSNVTITGNTSGEILKWNGSAWINNTLTEAGIINSQWTTTGSNIYYNTGNVGIGTTAPNSRLEVGGQNLASPPALGVGNHDFGITVAGVRGLYMGQLGNGVSYIQSQRIDGTAAAYNLLLEPNGGNVGIGTTAPYATLHSAYTSAARNVSLTYNTASAAIIENWGVQLAMGVHNGGAGSQPFYLQARQSANIAWNLSLNPLGGNVGIGTTAPSYTLDVTGTGRFTSTVTIGAYTLPATDGSANQVLKTNGSGTVSWATPSTEAFDVLSSSASVSWNCSTGLNKTLTRGGNFTLTLSNFANGMVGTIRLNITSATTITLGPSDTVTFKGSGNITSLATGIYYLSWICTSTSAIEYNIVKYV